MWTVYCNLETIIGIGSLYFRMHLGWRNQLQINMGLDAVQAFVWESHDTDIIQMCSKLIVV